ncbi:MAG TPA: histidine phosphatase family protein [Acidimicrobiales bacterium]|jgi:probable phosphoglycerate mutase|nr:histidine phosphatase family protein [Acidimicrobiales bacterium]
MSGEPTTRVLLIRHGQSEWNADGRWQGQADIELSDLGRAQAAAAAASLGAVDLLVASDLVRAATTAEILADALGIGPVYLDPDLRERHAGEWQGLTRAEIEARWPGYLVPEATATNGPLRGEQRRPPGWESDEELVARAERALHRVAAAVPGGDALGVTHGGLIMALERRLGSPSPRLSNLDARWVLVRGTTLELGERVRLLESGSVTVTTPEGI